MAGYRHSYRVKIRLSVKKKDPVVRKRLMGCLKPLGMWASEELGIRQCEERGSGR